MRILVTGSSGFTGQHFVTEAKALGHKVFGLDCDIRNFDDVSDRLSSVCPECIVHLGAKISSAWLLNLNTMMLM